MRHPSLTVESWSACGPAEAAARLRGRPHLVWLDSAMAQPRTGRWSIVACAPRWVMTARGSNLVIEEDSHARHLEADPLALLASRVEAEPWPPLGEAAARLPFV